MDPFFSKNKNEKDEIFNQLRESYMYWRQDLQSLNKPFFMIPTDFKYLFLKDISGGALKLYIYLGFHSKFYTGESWHTIEEISAFLEKDPRTVSKWFKELEDLGLIFRGQDGFKRKANTFLKPFGFSVDLINVDGLPGTKNLLDDMRINKELNRKLKFALILNFSFKEYTVISVYKQNNSYYCSSFVNFNHDEIKTLRLEFKKVNLFLDIYDIESPIIKAANKELTIYSHLLKYLNEEDN
ncbi:helix-turn-helix domain-containing protein [Priestia koreensis]|uniref:helix-turn-helix domain-containing protein n=1 Tax=Priestia koreensis TaxID=284581 RepID=UPI003D062FFA